MLGSSANPLQIPFRLLQVSAVRDDKGRIELKSFLSSSVVRHARINSMTTPRRLAREFSLSPPRSRKFKTQDGDDKRTRDPVKSLGQLTTAYYMQTQIGTPPTEALLLVDTGSELTWVQCKPCSNCSPTRVPPFDPSLSSTFTSEPCSSSVCSMKNLGFQSSCNTSSASCSFQVSYLDGSEANGSLGREVFSLQSWAGATSKMEAMIFGCASRDFQNPVDFSSGTLGLNRGRFSFPSQVGSRKGQSKTFSYCFPNRAEHLNSSGVIIFGESGLSPQLQYIPLQNKPDIASIVDFYYVDLAGISVDGELLPNIPASSFQIDRRTGNGGTYFDSGTTVSFLVEAAHSALVSAFTRKVSPALNRTRAQRAELGSELCYEVSGAELPSAPRVSLHFGNGAALELRETSLWVPRLADGALTVCLAFVNAGHPEDGGVNVIGNYQQQDYLIEHDLDGARIGFAAANCVVDDY